MRLSRAPLPQTTAVAPAAPTRARCGGLAGSVIAAVVVTWAGLAPVAAQEGAGLRPQAPLTQAVGAEQRLKLGIADLRLELQAARVGHEQPRGRIFGDYYLTGPGFGGGEISGGLRVTSGLAFGAHAAPLPAARPSGLLGHGRMASWSDRVSGGQGFGIQHPVQDPAARQALPYIGLGYTTLSARQRWSVSADIGLGGLRAGERVRFGSSNGHAQQVENILNDLRMAPVLQLGISYAF
jgi:hypothetical protein